jgi:hypothetical protein
MRFKPVGPLLLNKFRPEASKLDAAMSRFILLPMRAYDFFVLRLRVAVEARFTPFFSLELYVCPLA